MELSHHLLDLPVEPRLGKMLLYSIVLKCLLDPVLTSKSSRSIQCLGVHKYRRTMSSSKQMIVFTVTDNHLPLRRISAY